MDDVARVRACLDDAAATRGGFHDAAAPLDGAPLCRWRCRGPDGRFDVPVESSFASSTVPGETLAITRDIRDRVAAEEVAERSRSRAQTARRSRAAVTPPVAL